MKILIIGGYGYSNLGDEVLLASLLKRLRDHGISNITLLSKNPTESMALHRYPAYPSFGKLSEPLLRGRFPVFFPFVVLITLIAILLEKLKISSFLDLKIFKVLRAIKKADYIISCGGGFFNDGWWQFYPILFEHLLCTLLNKKLIITSQTLGKFKSRLLRPIIKYILKHTKYISVRDEGSLENLKEIGIETDKIFLTRDDAVNFYPSKPDLPVQPSKKSGEIYLIGLTVQMHRGYMSRDGICYKESRNKYYSSIVQALAEINSIHDIETVLLPSTNFRNDQINCHRLVNQLQKRGIPAQVKNFSNPDDLFNAIGQTDIHISANLHPTIFAAVQKIPFIAITYSTKIDDFVAALGLEDFLIRIDRVSQTALKEKILEILDNKEDYIDKLDKGITKAKKLADENFENILKIMGC